MHLLPGAHPLASAMKIVRPFGLAFFIVELLGSNPRIFCVAKIGGFGEVNEIKQSSEAILFYERTEERSDITPSQPRFYNSKQVFFQACKPRSPKPGSVGPSPDTAVKSGFG